jgi:hypothetical protein
MAVAAKRAMAVATRVRVSNGDSNKEGDDHGNEGGRQERGQLQQWQEQLQWCCGCQAINSNEGDGQW